jgi:hypothetical protein
MYFRNWNIARGNSFANTCFVIRRLWKCHGYFRKRRSLWLSLGKCARLKNKYCCQHFPMCWILFRIWLRIYYLIPYCICFYFTFVAKLVAFLALGWQWFDVGLMYCSSIYFLLFLYFFTSSLSVCLTDPPERSWCRLSLLTEPSSIWFWFDLWLIFYSAHYICYLMVRSVIHSPLTVRLDESGKV